MYKNPVTNLSQLSPPSKEGLAEEKAQKQSATINKKHNGNQQKCHNSSWHKLTSADMTNNVLGTAWYHTAI